MQLIVTRPASHSTKRADFNEAKTGVHLAKKMVLREGQYYSVAQKKIWVYVSSWNNVVAEQKEPLTGANS